MKCKVLLLLATIIVVSCTTFGKAPQGRRSHQLNLTETDSLYLALAFKDAYIDSLQVMIEYLNFQVDSLFAEIEGLSSKVLINDTFEIPYKYSFAGVEFDLTTDRVRTKLREIFDKEVKGASHFIPRSGIYFALFDSILTKNDIHPDVKYLAIAESNLNSMALSGARAGGIWQFIPSTAKIYNLKIDSYLDERRDIFKATEAACRYLHQAHLELNARGVDDWLLTLAAYNSGVGNIIRSVRDQGGNDFFSLILRVEETNNYVWRAIAIKMIFEFEELIFENKFERMPPLLETAKICPVTLNGYYDLADWATAQGTNAHSIWELNTWINISRSRSGRYSRINHLILPPGTYNILVPKDATPDVEKVAEIEAKFLIKNNSPFIIGASHQHRISRGETLSSIARRYGVSINDIRRWNNLPNDRIYEGQILHLQGNQTSESRGQTSDARPQTSETKGRYTVQAGDTISQIAEKLGVTTAHIMSKNNLQSSLIRVGQVLEY